MSKAVPVYLFRAPHFASGGHAVVSVAPLDVVVAIYREDVSGAQFLGVWGARNASRFRNAFRRAGLTLEVKRDLCPLRLVAWSTIGVRPGAAKSPATAPEATPSPR